MMGSSQAATSTNTNTALNWNISSSGWTGVAGDAWDSTNGQTNTAVFTNASGSITVTNTGIWFNGINYAPAAASSFTISGGTLNLSGSTPTINVSATTGSGLTISSQLAGTAGLIKSGVGVLTLSTSNAYSGATTVSAGTLFLNNASAIKNSASVTVANGATLQMASYLTYLNANAVTITGAGASGQSGALRFGNGSSVWAAPIILAGNSTIYSYGGAANTTLNGAITGTGNLRLASGGGNPTHLAPWLLNAASSYSGSTAIANTDGLLDITVKLGVDNALPTTTSLNLEGQVGQATNTFTTLDLNGKNQALAGLTDTGSSSSAANVAFGKRVINSSSPLSTLTLNITSGTSTYGTTGVNVLAGTIGGTTAAGVAANNLALTKTGTGTLVLGGNNTYTGATTISAGTLTIGAGGLLGAGSYAGNISNNATFIYSGTNNQTLSGIISGAGALTQNAASTLTLDPGAGRSSSVGNFSVSNGAVLLASGTLSVTSSNGLKLGGPNAPTFTLDGGTLNTTGNALVGCDVLGGRAMFTINSGTWTNTGSFISIQYGSTGNGSVMNVNGGLVDSPQIQLGQNAGTSTLNLNAGIVAVNSLFNTGSTAVLNLNGGTLRAKSTSTNFIGLTGNTSTVNVMTGGAIIDTQSFNSTISVPLLSGTANDGGLTKQGNGTLTLSANNTYTGVTTVSSGTLVVSNTSFIATILSNSTLVNFVTPPVVGTTNNVLSGPLNIASLANKNVTGLSSNTVGIFTNNPNLQVIVTSAGPTFNSLYGEGNENELGSNGLSYLMNYALGGTGPGSNPALPVLTSSGTSLTLTANTRNSGQGVSVVGQYAYDLAGQWTDVDLTPGVSSSVANTTVQSFTQNVEADRPKKFMRFKAIKQ
jgi:fibronectin-binding autotransporter adhesin